MSFLNRFFFVTGVILLLSACILKNQNNNDKSAVNENAVSIAVFVPGAMSGSPIYEMLVSGVKKAVSEFPQAELNVIEGGYNQAEWENKVTSLAAQKKYDLIVSSNPSLPVIAQAVSAKFPGQRFLLLDGELKDNPSIYTLRYNQREQAYMAGYLAALISGEKSNQNKVGLLAAQEYPVMQKIILPAYLEGAQAVSPAMKVDFRVVGNWFDAAKGAELTLDMIKSGSVVILAISGGANDGAVQAAAEAGAKVIWFDINGYAIRPGVVAGSCVVYQEKAAYNKTKLFLEGKLPFGTTELVGIDDGYVDFVDDDPLYTAAVSENVRIKQEIMLKKLRSGELILNPVDL